MKDYDFSIDESDEPSPETLEAMMETEDIIAHPERYKSYQKTRELFNELGL